MPWLSFSTEVPNLCGLAGGGGWGEGREELGWRRHLGTQLLCEWQAGARAARFAQVAGRHTCTQLDLHKWAVARGRSSICTSGRALHTCVCVK